MRTGLGLWALGASADGNVATTVYDSSTPFDQTADAWRALYDQLDSPSPYLDWRWVKACYDSSPTRVWYIVRVEKHGQTIGIVPFCRPQPSSPLHLSRILQAGYSGKTEIRSMTEGSIALILPGHEDLVWQEVGRAVSRLVRKGHADCAVFRGVGDFKPARGFAFLGIVAASRIRKGTNLATLPDSWCAYKKQLSKSMRDNIVYYPRRVTKAGMVAEVSYESHSTAIDTLISLHKTRAQDEKRTLGDYFQVPCQRQNLVMAHEAMGATGSAYVATLRFDGRPVAAQAFLENQGTLLASYSGFDPEYSSFSPLFILQSAVFQAAHERGVRQLNLLRGDAPWQARWGASVREPEHQVVFQSLRPVALVRAGIYVIRRGTVRYRARFDTLSVAGRKLLAQARLFSLSLGFQVHSSLVRAAASGIHAHLVHVRR